jgi:hypothetical protein
VDATRTWRDAPSHLKDVLRYWSKDFITGLSDRHGVLDPHGSLSGKDNLGLHREGHPFLQRIRVPSGNEGQFVQFQPDAVGDETGLKSWGPQVTVLVTQLGRELKGLYEDGFAICSRSDFFQNSIMDLPADFVGLEVLDNKRVSLLRKEKSDGSFCGDQRKA